ncbi:MAG: RluA family pseudouridine synthase [Candidatus Paceibacterota bacterium]
MIENNKIGKIDILYEDDDLVVINKPAGIAVHGDGKTKQKTLVEWIKKKFPETEGVGENMISDEDEEIERPGIVHRLDKETSGALIVAKNVWSYEILKDQFKERKISKMYVAFADGEIRAERGVIRKPIGRSKEDARKRSVKPTGDMKEAETIFRVIKVSGHSFGKATLLALWPKTGRTHQIRVHLNSIRHPVVADSLYGKSQNSLEFKRLALHAREINFESLSGKKITVVAPFPPDFKKAFEIFKIDEKDLLK